MAEETDGIEETLEGQLRVLVTAAGQVGERFARAREQSQRRAQASSEQEARELQSRLDAEQQTARAAVAGVHDREWWDKATPEQVGRVYQTARSWSDAEQQSAFEQASQWHRENHPEAHSQWELLYANNDTIDGRRNDERALVRKWEQSQEQKPEQEFAAAEQRVREELRERHGIDADNTGADPEAVRQAVRLELDRAERDRTHADAEHTRAEREKAEAQRLLTQADQQDRHAENARAAAEHEPDPDERIRAAAAAERIEARASADHQEGRVVYDSADRRDGTARELEARGINGEVVATRMRADVSQGKPAVEAVAGSGTTKAPKARKSRGRGSQVQRSGLDR